MPNRVRQHSRKLAGGGRAKVGEHNRTGRGRKALVDPGR
jgi:hypothetical protein